VSGKVYEYRTYTCNPKDFPSFLALTNEKIHMRTAHSTLLGYWVTEIGGQNEVVHLWEYDDLQHRQNVRTALVQDEPWMTEYMSHMRPMLQRQDNMLLRPMFPDYDFTSPPPSPASPGVYEVHLNYLKPGKLEEMRDRCAHLTERTVEEGPDSQ
jgi:hypothetical protein